jgi:ubiquitin C-terminal hydrolase
MNADLQCLATVHPLTEFLESNRFLSSLDRSSTRNGGSGGESACAFQELVSQYAKAKGSFSPKGFKDVIDEFIPEFEDRRQHDAFEFLIQFLCHLHLDLKSRNSPIFTISELSYSQIDAQRKFICSNADVSDDTSSFCMLPLPGRGRRLTLKDCGQIHGLISKLW